MATKKATFVMQDGPDSNTYIAPSGETFRVRKGHPFAVSDPADIEYFGKKSTFERIKGKNAKRVTEKTVKENKVEAEKDTRESGFEKKEETPEAPQEAAPEEETSEEEEDSEEDATEEIDSKDGE